MGITKLQELANQRKTDLHKIHDDIMPALQTGFDELDQGTHGFRDGDFIVIGARPAMGKDTFVQNLACNIAEHGTTILFFSSEVPNACLTDRILSIFSGVDIWKMRNGLLEKTELQLIDDATQYLSETPILIDDTTHMTMTELTARIRKANDDGFGLGAVLINDLTLLLPYDHTSSDYEQKLDEITHGLRDLARELELPIILMVEIPRYKHDGNDCKPNLIDLKQYGSLEKDADIIIFLHRHSYYSLDDDDESDRNITELIIRKNAHGPMKTAKIRFDPNRLKFVSMQKDKTMAFDFKKEYKEFYLPKTQPSIVEIPPMNYLAVRGKGDPNIEDSEYKQSISLLYAIAFTIKMSKRGNHQIAGYFDYVVPPLEGFWWQDGSAELDYSRKSDMNFISAIRLPDFVTKADFDWAVTEATHKKKQDFSKVEFFSYDEGTCVQCLHVGSYNDEPATIQLMDDFARTNGYQLDVQNPRYHHEIYLSDPRRVKPESLKTVLRHPIQ